VSIFSRDPVELSEKARAKARKKGVHVEGAVAVGYTYDDAADQFLVIFPDRVELVNRGKTGSLLRSGAGRDTVPMEKISSVECRNQGIYTYVEVRTSGDVISFKADHFTGPFIRERILEQLPSSTGASSELQQASPPASDAADQLRKLAELRDLGVLTEQEFAAKKAELLERL
jgi:hypothetical protein